MSGDSVDSGAGRPRGRVNGPRLARDADRGGARSRTCKFPGCGNQPQARANRFGAPPAYCDLPEHEPQAARKERQRRARLVQRPASIVHGSMPAVARGSTAVAVPVVPELVSAEPGDAAARARRLVTQLALAAEVATALADELVAKDDRIAELEQQLREAVRSR